MYIQYFTSKLIIGECTAKQTNGSCMLMVGEKSCAQEMVLNSSSWDKYPYVDTNEQQSVLKALELNIVQSICLKLCGMYAKFVRFSFLPNQASSLGQKQRKKKIIKRAWNRKANDEKFYRQVCYLGAAGIRFLQNGSLGEMEYTLMSANTSLLSASIDSAVGFSSHWSPPPDNLLMISQWSLD